MQVASTPPSGTTTVPQEPAFFVVYGDTNTGKSTSVIHSFPGAYFIGPRGGVTKIAERVLGVQVMHDYGQLALLEHIVRAIPLIEQGIDPVTGRALPHRPTAIVLDDFSVASENTLEAAKQMPWPTRSGKPNHFAPYSYTSSQIAAVKWAARNCSIHVICTCHEMPAWVDENTHLRHLGRPKLAGKEAPLSFPYLCDIILRAVVPRERKSAAGALGAVTLGATPAQPDPGEPNGTTTSNPLSLAAPVSLTGNSLAPAPIFSPLPDELTLLLDWPGKLEYDPQHPDWLTKARIDIPNGVPMNHAEVLRHNGYAVPRPVGLEYQEAIIDKATEMILAGDSETRVMREYAYPDLREPLRKAGLDKRTASFAMLFAHRDIKARVALRKNRNKLYEVFGL